MDNIWHKPDITDRPKNESVCVWLTRSGFHGGRYDNYYNCFCACASYFIDLRKVQKWAYLNDLLALESKLKTTVNALNHLSNVLIIQSDQEMIITAKGKKEIRNTIESALQTILLTSAK